jgi:hypothetical protein
LGWAELEGLLGFVAVGRVEAVRFLSDQLAVFVVVAADIDYPGRAAATVALADLEQAVWWHLSLSLGCFEGGRLANKSPISEHACDSPTVACSVE